MGVDWGLDIFWLVWLSMNKHAKLAKCSVFFFKYDTFWPIFFVSTFFFFFYFLHFRRTWIISKFLLFYFSDLVRIGMQNGQNTWFFFFEYDTFWPKFLSQLVSSSFIFHTLHMLKLFPNFYLFVPKVYFIWIKVWQNIIWVIYFGEQQQS